MLRIRDEEFKQLSVFNLLLPKSSLELKGELAVVDKILNEKAFPFFIFRVDNHKHSVEGIDRKARNIYNIIKYPIRV